MRIRAEHKKKKRHETRTFRPKPDGHGRLLRDDVVERARRLEEAAEAGRHGGVDVVADEAAAVLLPEGVPAGRAPARAAVDLLLVLRHRLDLRLCEDDEPAGAQHARALFEEQRVVFELAGKRHERRVSVVRIENVRRCGRPGRARCRRTHRDRG